MPKQLDYTFKLELYNANTREDLYKIPEILFTGSKCKGTCGSSVRILILNTPCNGFGDLMFAHKLANKLRSMYDAHVDIATTQPDSLKMLGESPKNLIHLKSIKSDQCRRYKYLKIDLPKKKYDLIFNAPVNMDYEPNDKDVRSLIPYSTPFNTFHFSEYGDDLEKNFDFATGVGEGYEGIFITDKKVEKQKRRYPYTIAYISTADNVPVWRKCIRNFIAMIGKKYGGGKNKVFEIIGNNPMFEYIARVRKKTLQEQYGRFFSEIVFVNKNKHEKLLYQNKGKHTTTLILNASVLPVPNKEMLSLIKYAVKDVLLTGDQSISDALSCCSEKNIWYQTVPWKDYFVQDLATEMNNKWLTNTNTTCGSLKTTKYRSNYTNFLKNNDFFKNIKPRLDAIILSRHEAKKKNSILHKFEKYTMQHPRGVRQIKRHFLEPRSYRKKRRSRK